MDSSPSSLAVALDISEFGEFILSLLDNDKLGQHSAQELIEKFLKEYSNTTAKFRACNVIVVLMQTNSLAFISSIQKVAAVALLLGAYGRGSESLSANPFAAFLHGLLIKPVSPKRPINSDIYLNEFERLIVARFVEADTSSSLWDEKLVEIIKGEEQSLDSGFPDLLKLMIANQEQSSLRVNLFKKSFSSIFGQPDNNISKNSETESESTEKELKTLEDPLSKTKGENNTDTNSYMKNRIPESRMITLAPPVHFANNELVWLLPSNMETHEFEIDPNACSEVKLEETAAQQLIKQAFKEALSISQRQALLNELQNDPKIANLLGVTPTLLPDLVENNPIVAIDVLLKLMEYQDMKNYLSALISMDMSVHSMEVVNRVVSKRLTSSVELPTEFLYLYISNCIKTCEGIQDKYVQNRLVRLLCVFLQSLIRNQIIDFQFLYIEILTFCVEFSRIREAAALYRLMKQVESEDPELREILLKKLEQHQHLSEAAKNFPNISKDKDSKDSKL